MQHALDSALQLCTGFRSPRAMPMPACGYVPICHTAASRAKPTYDSVCCMSAPDEMLQRHATRKWTEVFSMRVSQCQRAYPLQSVVSPQSWHTGWPCCPSSCRRKRRHLWRQQTQDASAGPATSPIWNQQATCSAQGMQQHGGEA